LFSLIERVGDDALIAANGVVAGDSFGNGHFLTSGGAMTGMIGHSARVLEYWQAREAGTSATDAIRKLADSIQEDTHAWLQVSAAEYSQAAPINFGAARIEQISKASGIDTSARANAIDAARRHRHELLPLDPSNWRRLFVRNGKVLSALPELDADHPLQRPEHAASYIAVLNSFPVKHNQETLKSSADQESAVDEQVILKHNTNSEPTDGERTLLRHRTEPEPAVGEQTLLRSSLSIGLVKPESAKIYAFLDIQQNEQIMQHIALKEKAMIVGRADPKRGITPDIDLTQVDHSSTVSRQHAQIRMKDGIFSIEDLGSRNKTKVGTQVLTSNKPESLKDGDVVSFGSVKATFRLLGTSSLPEGWSQS
jgi:pSer/pThr/pTyr-binding forkhead associated (FHA) protein